MSCTDSGAVCSLYNTHIYLVFVCVLYAYSILQILDCIAFRSILNIQHFVCLPEPVHSIFCIMHLKFKPIQRICSFVVKPIFRKCLYIIMNKNPDIHVLCMCGAAYSSLVSVNGTRNNINIFILFIRRLLIPYTFH